jgi:ankyrin repeat protein
MAAATTPQPEGEDVFSRGQEESTLTPSEDFTSPHEPSHDLAASSLDEHDDDPYEGHLLMTGDESTMRMRHSRVQYHQQQAQAQQAAYYASSPSSGVSPRPPRHPGQFSFSEAGRRRVDRHNPFEQSTNSNGSNSLVDPSSTPDRTDVRNSPSPRNNPFDESPRNNPFDELSAAISKEEEASEAFVALKPPPSQQPKPEEEWTQESSAFVQTNSKDTRTHSWDSDRQFPIREIERIQRKTRKLRKGKKPMTSLFRPQEEEDNEPEDDGFRHKDRLAAFPTTAPAPRSESATPTTASLSADGQGPRSSRLLPANQRAWNQTPPPGARRKSYFPAHDSLAEVLDQPTVSTEGSVQTTRSRGSVQAEKVLLQSFKRPSKSRVRSATPPTAYDEKKEDDAAAVATKTWARAKAVVLLPPDDAPSQSTQEEDAPTTADMSEESVPHTDNNAYDDNTNNETKDLTLHDLCAEASETEDIAWRNALYLLSIQPKLAAVADEQQFTPLHVCCLGPDAAPSFMIRALLYTHPAAARTPDEGGRLPLHLVAATSADVESMQLLVNEYPEGVMQADDFGLTPLLLLLRNVQVGWDVERIQILLGRTTMTPTADEEDEDAAPHHFLFRRGSHFKLPAQDVRRVLQKPRPVTRFTRADHEVDIAQYPPDIQISLRKLTRWRSRRREALSLSRTEEEEDDEDDEELNAAAISTPTTLQLPIHMVLYRAMHQSLSLPLSPSSNSRASHAEEVEFDVNSDDDEVDSSPPQSPLRLSPRENQRQQKKEDDDASSVVSDRIGKSHAASDDVMEVLRLLIEAYPEGLSMRDGEGMTPLMMVLSMDEELPSTDLVALLLGRRTSGATIDWASNDLPLHNLSSSPLWMNPAMVPSSWTKQLPLHIAAEEFLAELPLVQLLFEAYPAAIQVQDANGRTPLHLALSSYRKIPVDPRIMNMLFSDNVAQTRDRKGRRPLDVMLDNPQVLPDYPPFAWKLAEANEPNAASAYQRFFHASLLHLSSSGTDRRFLHDLEILPQWMRRQACVSSFVQEMLLEEIATPWKCAVIILDGLLLVALLTVFRLQMNEYIMTGSSLATWYTFTVFGVAAARFLLLGVLASLATKLGQHRDLILSNLWWWIDYAAMILVTVTSVLFNGTIDDDLLLSLGTGATGFLWWSVIGYLSRWSFSMAVFSGLLSQLSSYLVYVLIAFGAVVVAFGQMLYTVFQTSCEDAIVFSSVCTVRDSYRVIYLLMRGESLADEEGLTRMSPEAITMVAGFLFFVSLVAVGLLAIVVLVAGHADVDDIARRSYWEPMLGFVLSMNTLGFCGRDRERTCGDSFSAKMEVTWDLLTYYLTGNRDKRDTSWYAQPGSAILAWPLALLSIVFVPLWFLLGMLTLGYLWPPQIRRAVLRPVDLWRRRNTEIKSSEATAHQLNSLRSEAAKFKVLSYDRMTSIEREIRELKDLLYLAMREEEEEEE